MHFSIHLYSRWCEICVCVLTIESLGSEGTRIQMFSSNWAHLPICCLRRARLWYHTTRNAFELPILPSFLKLELDPVLKANEVVLYISSVKVLLLFDYSHEWLRYVSWMMTQQVVAQLVVEPMFCIGRHHFKSRTYNARRFEERSSWIMVRRGRWDVPIAQSRS